MSDPIGSEHGKGEVRAEKQRNPKQKAFFLREKGLKSWRARQDSNRWPSAQEARGLSVSVLPAVPGNASRFRTRWDPF